MAHTKKYILEHYECDGQLSIDDLPFQGGNVDNFVTNVDNISKSACTIYECVRCSLSKYCYPAKNGGGRIENI